MLLFVTVKDVDDDGRGVDVVGYARVVARVDALGPLNDERARSGVTHHFYTGCSFVVDHPFVLVPEDKVGSHAALPQVAS